MKLTYKVTQAWGTQIEAKRDGIAKKRDAQRWKKVNPRASIVPRTTTFTQSRYLEDPDVGVPRRKAPAATPVNQRRAVPHPPANHMARFQDQLVAAPETQNVRPRLVQPRHDIMAALKRHPDIILAETVANRPSRQRRPPPPLYVLSPNIGRRRSASARR